MLIFGQMASKHKKGPSFYSPTIELPVSQLQRDLIRTFLITLFIFGLLGGLYYWLERAGGWKILTQVWQYGR